MISTNRAEPNAQHIYHPLLPPKSGKRQGSVTYICPSYCVVLYFGGKFRAYFFLHEYGRGADLTTRTAHSLFQTDLS